MLAEAKPTARMIGQRKAEKGEGMDVFVIPQVDFLQAILKMSSLSDANDW